jgi:hypothetical protein
MTRAAYTAALHAENLRNAPAWRIVTRPGYELWNHMATNQALISQLCRNFHHYGRTRNWQWITTVGQNNAPLGRPLIAGTTNATNCGGFNGSVRWIASHILNLPDTVFTNTGATTTDKFITRTGTRVIDAAWTGNVRTLLSDFPALRAYRFTAHSWNRLIGGQHYDASTDNRGFANKLDLYWCTLGLTLRNQLDCYLVTMRRATTPIPGPAPYYCIGAGVLKQQRHQFPIVGGFVAGATSVTQTFINNLPAHTGPGNWPAFLLVSIAHLPPGFVANYL